MTQVSKKHIDKKTNDRIWLLFLTCITESDNKKLTEELVTDLLTPTERVMLTKRFSIAYMLIHGYHYDEIAIILRVSTGTVANVAGWLKSEGDGLRKIITKIEKQEKWQDLISEINLNLKVRLITKPITRAKKVKNTIQRERLSNTKPF